MSAFKHSTFYENNENLKIVMKYGIYSLSQFKCHKSIFKSSLVKTSENNFILLPAFYPIICLMKASKNFEKIAILNTQELVSFLGAKTHFGKLALK